MPQSRKISKALKGSDIRQVIEAINETLYPQYQLAVRANLIGEKVYLIVDQHEIESWQRANTSLLVPINPRKKKHSKGHRFYTAIISTENFWLIVRFQMDFPKGHEPKKTKAEIVEDAVEFAQNNGLKKS